MDHFSYPQSYQKWLREKKQKIEDEVHGTFKPRWVDDKLVTPYIKKDGTLSKRGLTDEEYINKKIIDLRNDRLEAVNDEDYLLASKINNEILELKKKLK